MDIESGKSAIDHSQSGLIAQSAQTMTMYENSSGDNTPAHGVDLYCFNDKMMQWDLRCPMEEVSFGKAMYDRVSWLIGLLLFQSCSSYILADNVELLQTHPAIIFYLTMLVGAGGNAGIRNHGIDLQLLNLCVNVGNQASVRIIRGMALGSITEDTKKKILMRELLMGFAICALLSLVGLARVHFSSHTTAAESVAITVSLSVIVFSSIIIGSLLPFLLRYLNFDPMHASTSIQVIMDIGGVLITCLVSSLILNSKMI